MDAEAIVQLVTLVVAAFGIVWHQQHSSDRTRGELHESSREHRQQLQESDRLHREALHEVSREHREASREHREALQETSRRHDEALQEASRRHDEALQEASRRHDEALEASNRLHREDHNRLRGDFDRLSEGIVDNGVRLARIEGHLGIGVPAASDESGTPDGSGEPVESGGAEFG